MHADSRILQIFTTAELLYLLFSLLTLLLQGKWYGFFTEKTGKKHQAVMISWQLRQARSKISRIHSYRCKKNGKCCYAGNELAIGVLSNDTVNCLREVREQKVQDPLVFIQFAPNLDLQFFGCTTWYSTGNFRLVENVLASTVTHSVIMECIYPDFIYRMLLK
jgi:hypothetical protein